MDASFEQYARVVFERAGIEVSDDDLALVSLMHTGYEANVAALDRLDTARFPFEPIDPSKAPER